jgi:lysophospholipid acyltransferase (LPLAT)-like uncharacterized protein
MKEPSRARTLKHFKFLMARLFLFLLYRMIRLYSLTFRLTVENEREWLDHLAGGGRVLICTWHQQFFPAIRHFKNYEAYQPALMISRSRDGDFIAGVARRSGWFPVRGSSSREGGKALAEMVERLKMTRLAGHVVDGPRGPAGRVKTGLVRLALAADAVIVPFYVSADRAWTMNSWDRFMIPKPFARVRLRFDRRIRLEPAETPAEMEEQRQRVEEAMRPGLIP